jgi:small conductance mechanosensitive channel
MANIPKWFDPYYPVALSVLWSIVILVIGWIASKWAYKLVVRVFGLRKFDPSLGRFFGSIVQYTVLAVALIASLESVGVKTTSLVAILASAGLAIGLALQGSLGNFASGVLILFFRPFRSGDMVTIAGQTGVVTDIGIFATTLTTPDNQKVIVGNSAITSGVIINLTSLGTRRGEIDVSIAIGPDVGKLIASIEQATKRTPLVLADPAPAVAFVGFGKGSMELKVLAWSKSEDYLAMMHNVRRTVYEELAATGVKTAIPFMMLHAATDDLFGKNGAQQSGQGSPAGATQIQRVG